MSAYSRSIINWHFGSFAAKLASLMTSLIQLTKQVPAEFNQQRLDVVLSALLPEYSRGKIQQWITADYVTVDGKLLRTKDKVQTDQVIVLNAPLMTQSACAPQAIALDVIYEDQDIIIINKPPGLVVHPGAGCMDNTLLNALLYHYPELAQLPRAGIIHRLDKDTSGLLVVVRNLTAHTKLVADLQARKIKREYVALVYGRVTTGGVINAPIGRHPTKRIQMAVVDNGKPAVTHYRVIKQFTKHTQLKMILETGRTHQIRVHLAHIHYPIVGDPVYGKGLKLPANSSPKLRQILSSFKRQALHAERLGLIHPSTGKALEWQVDPPVDMQELLACLP